MSRGSSHRASYAFVAAALSRRSFSFIEHAGLVMPISLEAPCENVPCDVMTSCRTGSCVSSRADCSESTRRCESEAEPVIAPDGGIVLPPDAMALDGSADGGSDAPADGPAGDAPGDAPLPDAAGGPEGGTNICPRNAGQQGPDDCFPFASGNICCRDVTNGTYHCGSEGAATCVHQDDLYECTGRLHCSAGMYCCLTQANPKVSACVAAPCPTTYLCGHHNDCPPDKPWCVTILAPATDGGGPIMACSDNPTP